MHLIWQTQAITNSTHTFLELTFQHSSESGSGFDLIPKEQELNKERKISRQHMMMTIIILLIRKWAIQIYYGKKHKTIIGVNG